MEKKIWLEFTSSTNDVISDIVSGNETFDACTVWVMYAGENRNRTSISKAAVENAIGSLPYCPIVCHYIAEEDRIGGHDIAFVKTPDGAVKMVNLTDPVGVIPAGAQYRWEKRMDGNVEHEYLVVDGLLWKRSAAYSKLKRDGASGQSMEITVKDGKQVDGVFQIYDFLFTAFCILGEDVEPCFESASLETFSLGDYKARFERMMDDLQKEPSVITAAPADDDRTFSLKGGEGKVNLDEMMAKYGLTSDDINFDLEGLDEAEIERKFSELHNLKFEGDDPPAEGGEGGTEGSGTGTDGSGTTGGGTEGSGTEGSDTSGSGTEGSGTTGGDTEGGSDSGTGEGSGTTTDTTPSYDPNTNEEDDASGTKTTRKNGNGNFALMAQQLAQELYSALRAVKYHDAYWDEDVTRYYMIDYDAEAQMVYAEDMMNDVLCGFTYAMDGDKAIIDFNSYKRKKVVFADFDEGDQVVSLYAAVMKDAKAMFDKRVAVVTADLDELRKFHDETMAAKRNAQLEELFASFADLNGNESFEALRNDCGDLSMDELSEKCFAIRGRSMKMNFSANPSNQSTAVRLPVERTTSPADDNEPYHGVFAKYGFGR